LTFYTAVPGKTTTFGVTGDSYEQILLDKNATTFNGRSYMFRAPIPMADPDSQITIKTRLLNPGKKTSPSPMNSINGMTSTQNWTNTPNTRQCLIQKTLHTSCQACR